MSLGDDMVSAIMRRYPGERVQRVVDAWERVQTGKFLKGNLQQQGYQAASSYIEGIKAEAWHDVGQYPWVAALESNASVIASELRKFESEVHQDTRIPGLREEQTYGHDWRVLALQDKTWGCIAHDAFPKTTTLIQGSGVPSVEVFFARQPPGCAIQARTDDTNFYVTINIGLDVPDGDCWIQVGNERRKWAEGKAIAFDTSFLYSMGNEAESARKVLVVRFWHPDITALERDALMFIFRALEEPSILREALTLPTRKTPMDVGPETSTCSDDRIPTDVGISSAENDIDSTERLDSFLNDLKAEGLLPDVATPEDFLARGPGNRSARRKAGKKKRRSP